MYICYVHFEFLGIHLEFDPIYLLQTSTWTNMQKVCIRESSNFFLPMSGKKNILCFSTVTKLTFSACSDLRIICNSMIVMHNLRKFSIFSCPLILKLPSSISEFRKLKIILIDTCKSLVCLPVDIGKLSKLTNFAIRNNNIIAELPESISECKNIRIMTVRGCGNMKTITKSIENMYIYLFIVRYYVIII